ncbi:MAG: HD domain-containing protein [Candidatus Aenigmarchaeota archaeon]|nr:HD domain-containing protein [Candidatus Aenigmarchaeota archaeon]
MKRLIELANKIKDEKLRKQTIEILKNPKISNKSMKYPAADYSKTPAWPVGAHHDYEGGLIDHTCSVTKNAIDIANNLKKTYKAKINLDHLIAGALLHDIMKIFLMKKKGKTWDFTGCILDHADFSGCELYARDFPEEVVHIVIAHGGEMGYTAATPRTIEATLVSHCDMIDSSMESMINEKSELDQLKMMFMMPEEASD